MKKIIISIAGILFIAASCGKHEENILKEDQIIERFVAYLNNQDYIIDSVEFSERLNMNKAPLRKPASGIARIVAGDSVYFYYAASYLANGTSQIFFDTNIKEIAEDLGLDTFERDFSVKKEIAGVGRFISGLDKGLTWCAEGEECFLIFNSDLGYGSNTVGIIPAYSPICFHIIIQKVIKNS